MKNPKEIITEITGATYRVPLYEITNSGLESTGEGVIQFVKGAKDDESKFRQVGFMTETLLEVCKQYLRDVQKGDLKDDDTQQAILDIQAALDALACRQEKRKVKGVAQTYKP